MDKVNSTSDTFLWFSSKNRH